MYLINEYDGTQILMFRSRDKRKLQEKMKEMMLEQAFEIENEDLVTRIKGFLFEDNTNTGDADFINGHTFSISPDGGYIDDDEYFIVPNDLVTDLDKE